MPTTLPYTTILCKQIVREVEVREAGEGVIPEANENEGGARGYRCSGGARSACSRAPAAAPGGGGGARPEREEERVAVGGCRPSGAGGVSEAFN